MQPRDLVAFDLKAARKKQNLSQIQAAEILCTTQPTISRWEAEGKTPAICRKAWDQHWLLEGLKNGSSEETKADSDNTTRNKRTTVEREEIPQVSDVDKRVRRGRSSRLVEGRRRSGRDSNHRTRIETSEDEAGSAFGLDAED